MKLIVVISQNKRSLLNNIKIMKTLWLWLFQIFIFLGIINESYAQVTFEEHLNNLHIYTRNKDGSISDSNIVNNENYLRQYISNSYINYNKITYSYLEAEVPFNNFFNQLLANELPSNNNLNSHFEEFYKHDDNFKRVINSINALPLNEKQLERDRVSNIIFTLRQFDDIEKKTESFIYLIENYKDYKSDIDTLLTQTFFEIGVEIDNYCNDLTKLIENKTWFEISYQQIPVDGYKTAEELDSEPMKYIRCLKKIGDFMLSKMEIVPAFHIYSQAYLIAFFDRQLLELGIIEGKIAAVYQSEGTTTYSKHAIQHLAIADSLFGFTGRPVVYSKEFEAARIKSLNLYSDVKSILDVAYLDEMVDMFKISITKELSYQEKSDLFSAIGLYFAKTGYPNDLNIAKMYLQASLGFSMNDNINYDFDQIHRALSMLSWINSWVGDKENCVKYNDWALKLAEKHHKSYSVCYDWFLRASYIMNVKEYDEAVTFLKKGFEFAQKENIPEEYWGEFGYSVAKRCYSDLKSLRKNDNYQDTIDYYAGKLSTMLISSKEELQNLLELDYKLQQMYADLNNQLELYKKEKEYNYKISELESGINYKQFISDLLELNFIKKNKSYDSLRTQFSDIKTQMSIDSLKQMHLFNENERLRLANDTIQQQVRFAVQEKGTAEESRNWAIGFAIGIVFLSLAFSTAYYFRKKRKFDQYISKKNSEIQKSNTRAAISQLYARTDSHDLGHVLDAYKTKTEFYFNEENGQYIFVENSNLKEELLKKYTYKNSDGKELCIYPNLMGYFNQYLKTRMDFRADVATTDPNSLTTLDFYQDIFIPFNNNMIFNNRISGIDDKNLKYKIEIFKDDKIINDQTNLLVAVPNDVLGCQAMYIIWSNVIRNTVKHGELTDQDGILTLTLKIKDYTLNANYFEISFCTSVYREKSFIDDLVNKRNVSFDDKIWDQDKDDRQGRLRDNSLGTIEMATCATYLRKMPVTELEATKYDLFSEDKVYMDGNPFEEPNGSFTPMIMYAYAQPKSDVNGTGDKYSLGYKFYLLKPKEILVICDQPEVSGNSFIKNMNKGALSKSGIEFIKPNELEGETFNHNFLVFSGILADFKIFQATQALRAGSLPKRQVCIDPEKTFENIGQFKNECWNRWLVNFHQSVNIYDCTEGGEDLIYPEIEDKNSSLNVHLYNHHTSLSRAIETETIKTLNDGNYHEMMCGHHWTKKNLNLQKEFFRKSPSLLPYIESVFTNVLILDERIQKSIVIHDKKYADKIPFTTYFNQLGVFIPYQLNDEDPDLNKKNLMAEKGKIIKYIKKRIDNTSFIIIHLGMLEKLLKNKSNKNDEAIDEILNELISGEANRKKVVITSGRGKANNVNPDISYVPISLVQNAIETTFDKYRLVQILYNSRKSL